MISFPEFHTKANLRVTVARVSHDTQILDAPSYKWAAIALSGVFK